MALPGRPVEAVRVEPSRPHLPMRPLWLCRRCGQPWPCGAAKVALLAGYRDSPVSLFLCLASCLHDAIDDLRQLHPHDTGGTADVFDRFLGWPTRHRSRRPPTDDPQTPART
ncbi:hypothetical protein [Verrucosispora sp. TAA-831]|uniref:hypothetical protein n=1 Tax=Verrucosispora sp. TAA-831 TaxID=3422227 RepID=UPI003D6E36CB